ncbi:MAG TPA: hypothetical protein VJ377_06925 [Dehalococcoidales bacterium]|nr:hypothetical protein [Dehalococcoidales bacterium]
MADEVSKKEDKATRPLVIKFKCQRCGKDKPLEDMRSVTRFLPVLVVCRDCVRELR